MDTKLDLKQQNEWMRQLFSGKKVDDTQLDLRVEHCEFHSAMSFSSMKKGLFEGDLYYHELVDQQHPGNAQFTYPVVLPAEKRLYREAIVLLHGLNEKSWDKYLSWAAALVKRTGRPVILFPIAYHMNRAPQSWSDPRVMKDVVSKRTKGGGAGESSFANAALSTRLGKHPELFIYSGVQSYYDLCALSDQVHKGDHPLFEANSRIDFFAYSIGAFLAQILAIANPGERFTHSRLFLFAGGPTFDRMRGTSRYIMDIQAFQSLLTLKQSRILKKIHRELQAANLPGFEEMWKGFTAMLGQRKGRKLRQMWIRRQGHLLQVLAMKDDRVMPAPAIIRTLKSPRKTAPVRIDVVDFPYAASHENPFPLNDEKITPMVNRTFDLLMLKAAKFYLQPEQAVIAAQPLAEMGQVVLSVV